MTEQKNKPAGLVIKTAATKKQKEEKKLYTIISCCVGAIFLLTIFVPLLSKDESKASGRAYKNVSFDLADLAVDDEAEKVLLEMNKYSDIPKQKIAGGIFDKKDKEARQEADKTEGVPAAPDADYKVARDIKQAKKNKGVARAPIYSQSAKAATAKGNLSKGGMVSASGGSSGVSSSIWTSPDKSGQKGAKGAASGAFGNQQLIAATGAKGRASGLLRAIDESKRGANSQNADTAAQAAADAFTNNNLEAEDDGLADGMDELADAFNAEEFANALNDKELTDLKDDLEKEKEKQENKNDPCSQPENKMSWECYWGPALANLATEVLKTAVQTGINAAINSNGSGAMSRNDTWLRNHCGTNCFGSDGTLLDYDTIKANYGETGIPTNVQNHYNRYRHAEGVFNRLNGD